MRALLACLLCVGCAPAVKPFTVSDGFIRDSDGRALIMRGVNISGMHKDPPFFDFHQPPDYVRVHDQWGMNATRFLVSWAALEPAPDQYDDAYVAKIAERMDWAQKAGLLVVIDMHQDLYGLGFPVGNGAPQWTCDAQHYANFLATYSPTDQWFLEYLNPDIVACYDHFWQSDDLWTHYANAVAHLAAKLKDKPAIVGVDLMNEPNWGSVEMTRFESQDLQPFYERIVPTIRAAAPDWLMFTEPAGSRNLGVATGLQKLPFDDVVYAPHSYDATAEQGDGFPAGHRADVAENARKLRGEANALHAALWIGEYGGMSNKPGIVDYMDAEYDAAGAVAGSTIYWDDSRNDDGYGLLRSDGSEKTELLDAVVRPYPAKIAGTPSSYSFDAKSRTFKLTMGRAEAGTSDVVIPSRVYPDGVDVDCGSCRHTIDGQLLHLDNLVTGVVVTVTPAQ